MRGTSRTGVSTRPTRVKPGPMEPGPIKLGLAGVGLTIIALTACAAPRSPSAVEPSSASTRAARRLFDGAPPVIPHAAMGARCVACHQQDGVAVAELGFSPPSPHEITVGMSATSRCEQCHVYARTESPTAGADAAPQPWVRSRFVGLAQDLRSGRRLYPGAPPVMPHATLMRENCRACHTGQAAREEIRTDHPERLNCRQCHVEAITVDRFTIIEESSS